MCKYVGLIGASIVGVVALFSFLGMKGGSPPPGESPLAQLAVIAAGEDKAAALAARKQLRQAGQPGLDALFKAFPEFATSARAHTQPVDAKTVRWIDAVEFVSRQRDAAFARLYWHTDLDEAIAAATEQSRPILSLRLLGNLDEDRSCANSRYFRTVLYADPSVSDYLRENYVLHWQSVRPVPHISIDMGDGRTIERTITGNSAHYVLDSTGAVVDVIPGLWGAEPFLEVLRKAHGFSYVKDIHSVDYYRPNRHAESELRDLARIAAMLQINPPAPDGGTEALRVDAKRAMQRALSKSRLEQPFIHQMAAEWSGESRLDLEALARAFPTPTSTSSRSLMWQKRFGPLADTRNARQQQFMHAMISTFEHTLAMDTVLNRFELRPQALRWIAESDDPINLDALNERVYADLFLTPLDDPWMGLVPSDAYAALDREGLIDHHRRKKENRG